MITEDYVSFETAKLLKEKGFVGECVAYYSSYKDNNTTLYRWWHTHSYVDVRNNDYTLVPTLQMAMKWLREVHNLHIDVDPSEGNWNPTVLELGDWTCAVKFGDNIPIQDSYEQACEAAIKYCLENLI